MKRLSFALFVLITLSFNIAREILAFDISTVLMRSTFKIQSGSSFGTVFILGEPIPDMEGRVAYVLFTARHVLDKIEKDTAILWLRKKNNNKYEKVSYDIRVRNKGTPLWKNHPDVDLSCMRISLPKIADVSLLTTDLIATDEFIEKYEIHPGEDLLVLGYPLGAGSNEAGFPVLRSGRIASFPLLPTKDNKTFLLDFEVFPGNSGGPVFIKSRNRAYGGSTHIGIISQVMGIVSGEKFIPQKVETLDEITIKKHKLSLAVIVHASFMKELLGMLPQYTENSD